MEIVVVNAFVTDRSPLSGNPAAVVILPPAHLTPTDYLSIANQMNLSETAFVTPSLHPDKADYHLRWYTPQEEVTLCGHATLAAAHALFTASEKRDNSLPKGQNLVRFHTLSGILSVTRSNTTKGAYVMDFPLWPLQPLPAFSQLSQLAEALGVTPSDIVEVQQYTPASKLVVVLNSSVLVRDNRPDHTKLSALGGVKSVTITARADPNDGGGYDIVSRHYAPSLGIPEDPVTGSAHCMLIDYWSSRLGKNTLRCFQASARQGLLLVTIDKETKRVNIEGFAHIFLTGKAKL
eukprot:PhF_6_TR22308/c0_g1_i1/m.31570